MRFRISRREDATVFTLYRERETIWLDPPYQRLAGIWPMEKRQLLIDSLLNGFDVPKFYLHDFYPGRTIDEVDYRYAIIDGKQRLSAIWDYIDGKFALSPDTELLNNGGKVGELTYADLQSDYPNLKSEFDSRVLDVVTIETEDIELVEEMFSRLNEGAPLSAAEKRNAFGGPLPPVIRRIAGHGFFGSNVPFTNSRYRHFDLVAKFLLLLDEDQIVDLKKAYLDEFVIRYRDEGLGDAAAELEGRLTEVLRRMRDVFVDRDPLLRQVGMLTLYFILYSDLSKEEWPRAVSRPLLVEFEDARSANRKMAEDAEDGAGGANYSLLEFDRLAQSPNDEVALDYRIGVLKDWLQPRVPG